VSTVTVRFVLLLIGSSLFDIGFEGWEGLFIVVETGAGFAVVVGREGEDGGEVVSGAVGGWFWVEVGSSGENDTRREGLCWVFKSALSAL